MSQLRPYSVSSSDIPVSIISSESTLQTIKPTNKKINLLDFNRQKLRDFFVKIGSKK